MGLGDVVVLQFRQLMLFLGDLGSDRLLLSFRLFDHVFFFLDPFLKLAYFIFEFRRLGQGTFLLLDEIIKLLLNFCFATFIFFQFLVDLINVLFKIPQSRLDGRFLTVNYPQFLVVFGKLSLYFCQIIVEFIFLLCQFLLLLL